MNRRAERDVEEGQGVADENVRLRAARDRRADRQAVRGQGVALLAVRVMQQGDAGGAVRIVFDCRHFRRNAVLVALEVDDAVLLLVSAADESGGDPAAALAAAGLRLPLRQRLLRTRLRDLIEGVMRLGS